MADFNSVHLQDFPDVAGIDVDNDLVEEMDLVQSICSVALFLRDKQNLRVRLPLKSIKIIGNDIGNLEKYSFLISDEINVKNVFFEENLEEVADFVLEVNLKILGAKYGEKLKEIMAGVKNKTWIKDGNNIKIGSVVLEPTEFTLKLKAKKESPNIEPLPNNKMLIELDTNITKELELEGIARDLVRNIQQKRKEQDLELSDKINLIVKTGDEQMIEAIDLCGEYIKEQTLSLELKIEESDGDLEILITKN
jgi:isoleucyl-tRNA synthetase